MTLCQLDIAVSPVHVEVQLFAAAIIEAFHGVWGVHQASIRYNKGPVDKIKYGLEKKVSNPYFLS